MEAPWQLLHVEKVANTQVTWMCQNAQPIAKSSSNQNTLQVQEAAGTDTHIHVLGYTGARHVKYPWPTLSPNPIMCCTMPHMCGCQGPQQGGGSAAHPGEQAGRLLRVLRHDVRGEVVEAVLRLAVQQQQVAKGLRGAVRVGQQEVELLEAARRVGVHVDERAVLQRHLRRGSSGVQGRSRTAACHSSYMNASERVHGSGWLLLLASARGMVWLRVSVSGWKGSTPSISHPRWTVVYDPALP
jgi:hypothetical protein